VKIDGVPFVRQKPDFCGEACVEMGLRKLGHRLSQDDFFALSRVDPALGRGVLAKELARGLRRIGLDPGAVWYRVPRRQPAPELERQFRQLHADLLAGVPSIVCTHYDRSPGTTQHFRLVLGYDSKTDEVIYHEPAEDNGRHRRMPRREMMAIWPLRYRAAHDIVIRMPLRPKKVQIPPRPRARHTAADYAQHVMKLQPTFRRLRGRFSVVVEPPFVVAGTISRRDMRATAEGLIRWSVAELKQRYFARDPKQIITIWLFDHRTYETNALRLTGRRAGTPFGFYSPSHRALIMNIRTGGGTLVHEIVHPFMEANFPDCPPWFNEGMGSLYEGVGRRNHRIWGYINWRLPGLQRAIRRKQVLPPFAALMRQNETQFYEQDPGTNYSQSRYLVYYLQDRGQLRTYYHQFVKNHRADPTGYKTLQQQLGVRDMAAFQREWERYVLKLKYTRPAVK